jgi:hypothetical protein
MEHPAGCLHCEVNKLIEKRIQESEKVDVTDMTAKLAESLAEIILFAAEPEEQGKLLAHTIVHLGEYILQKGGAAGADTTH